MLSAWPLSIQQFADVIDCGKHSIPGKYLVLILYHMMVKLFLFVVNSCQQIFRWVGDVISKKPERELLAGSH